MVMKKKEMVRLINNFYRGLCRDMKVDPKPTKWPVMWVAVMYVIILVDPAQEVNMTKREKGRCKNCGTNVGEENLSNHKLCYECARSAMLDYFDRMWALQHPSIEEQLQEVTNGKGYMIRLTH